MAVFLTERIRNIKGWIPPEDIDGLDVFRAQYCRDAVNIDFENGFIRNVRKPFKVDYPQGVLDIIDDDWKVISSSFFKHAIRGFTWFYMIRNAITSGLKFVVTDATFTDGVELQIFDGNISPPTDKLVEVNYMIVEDQLKINLNVTSNYVNDETTSIYMSLTLVYLEEIDSKGVFPGRTEGWYLTPRWLGWSYFDDRVQFKDTSPSNITITKDNFTDFDYSGVSIAGGDMRFPPGAFVKVNCRATGGIIVNQSSGAAGQLVIVRIFDQPSDDVYIGTSFDPNNVTAGDYENDWQYLFNNQADAEVKASSDNVSDIIINSITFKTLSADILVLGIAEDNQVIPIKAYPNKSEATLGKFPIEDWQFLEVLIEDWDYRLDVNMQVYVDDGSGILRMYEVTPLNITAGVGSIMEIELRVVTSHEEHPLVTAPTTLNFTYGLGAQVKAFHEETEFIFSLEILTRGDFIYSEVTYRGREYYVKDDNRLYMSHISGSGLLQSDSFPFDEDLEFGFIRSDYEFEILKTLAITPLDELLVNADQDNLVYTIQQGQTLIYRRIKSVNGEIGIGNRQSLLRSTKGTGIATGLFWTNPEGIYGYAGGVKEPIRINEIKLRNYWQSQINSDSVISMFDPFKKEILFANDKNIIVYDMVTAEWKPYQFDTGVLQFIGIKDTMAHFLGDDNNIYRIDQSKNVFFEGNFTTHDTTGYQIGKDGKPSPMSELDDKIMQELYSSVTNGIGGSIIVNIYADDNLIEGSIGLSTVQVFQSCWTWLLIRYRRIRIKVYIAPANIELREIGFTFSIPSQAPAGAVYAKEGGFGFNFGKVYGE